MSKIIASALLFAFSLSHAALPPAIDGVALPSLAPMLERTTPAVVNVNSKTRVQVRNPFFNDPFFERFFGGSAEPQERVENSLGSGVIIDANKGLVLTNNHVVENADQVSVTLNDGRTLPAELVGTDPDTDVALIRIKAERLIALPLANSDALRVGDFVVAVGNPFGLGQSATSGIVSALGRSGLRGLGYQNFIQTDASINPGNSGGALVNLRGELIGINTAIFSPSGGNVGIGFAIPANLARNVMNQLLAFGEVQRGSLGVQVQDLSESLAKALAVPTPAGENPKGAVIAQVVPDTPAAKAGLQASDVVIALAGKPIANAHDFTNAEGFLPLATQQQMTVLRAGKPLRVNFSLVPISTQSVDAGKIDPRLAGVRLSDITSNARQKGAVGIVIAAVTANSALAKYGLQKGDLIAGVNRYQVNNLAEFSKLMGQFKNGANLTIYRNNRAYVLQL
jgi:serine protease DegQ